jgi:hypothetical protein
MVMMMVMMMMAGSFRGHYRTGEDCKRNGGK